MTTGDIPCLWFPCLGRCNGARPKVHRAVRSCKFKPARCTLWAEQNGKAGRRRSCFQRVPPLLPSEFCPRRPYRGRPRFFGITHLHVKAPKHHYPHNKKVVTWTGPTFFDVSLPSPVLKIMMFRSNYLHLSDTSGMAILWEVTGGAAFSVWRSRQLDIRRWASSIWAAVIRDPMTLNRSLSLSRNPIAILAHVYARM